MTLLVRNFQKAVKLNLPKLKTEVKTLRRILGLERYDMAVLCVENEKIKELNKIHRGEDKVTNLLTLAVGEIKEPGKLPDPWSDIADLGDMFVGVPHINELCQQEGKDLEQVLPLIIAHGMCHLIGYDDKTLEQKEQMRERESYILKEFNRVTGSDLKPL